MRKKFALPKEKIASSFDDTLFITYFLTKNGSLRIFTFFVQCGTNLLPNQLIINGLHVTETTFYSPYRWAKATLEIRKFVFCKNGRRSSKTIFFVAAVNIRNLLICDDFCRYQFLSELREWLIILKLFIFTLLPFSLLDSSTSNIPWFHTFLIIGNE